MNQEPFERPLGAAKWIDAGGVQHPGFEAGSDSTAGAVHFPSFSSAIGSSQTNPDKGSTSTSCAFVPIGKRIPV
jgi:hypothetical protein